MLIHRRELLVSGAAGGAALLGASAVASAAPEAQSRSRAAAGPGKHAPVALPFKPSSLTGISEKTIDYGADHSSYVEALFKNAAWEVVEQRYDRALKASAALG
jgi:hypothetical protein